MAIKIKTMKSIDMKLKNDFHILCKIVYILVFVAKKYTISLIF